jgi:hypothetical protein
LLQNVILGFGVEQILWENGYETRLGLENLEGRQLGRSRHRWEDDIRIDLGERAWDGVDWRHLAQDRGQRRALANTVINLWAQ